MTANMQMGAGGEFDLIRRMLAIWGELASGVGGDTSTVSIPQGMRAVISTDTSVENVHFRRGWLTPHQIGYRATAAALSDLAAAGAIPAGVLLALTIPDEWLSEVDDLAHGIGDAVRIFSGYGARILGGDTSRGTALSLGVTVIGASPHPLARSGAAVGDRLVVTGDLGRSGRALAALSCGQMPDPSDMERFSHPVPRIAEGKWFADRGATAAIDISDGLASELGHMAAASAVHLEVDVELVPASPGIDAEAAMRSGEEYELLVAIPAEISIAGFESELGTSATEIGRVVEGPAGITMRRGGRLIAPPPGHNHF